MKNTFLLFLVSLLLFSCAKPSVTPPEEPIVIKDTIIKDLAYGTAQDQKLDLYLPANRDKNTKLIVLIHGGGWSTGNKGELSFMANRLKKKNFAVANINYRLSTPKNPDNYKMQLDDVESVVKFLKSKTTVYTYGADALYFAGHSAGAHLALAYSYTRNSNGNIKAVAGMASPTNLYTLSYYNANIADPIIIPFLGGKREEIKQRYMDCSPFYQVTATSPPTILFSGDLFDFTTPLSQSKELESALNKAGVQNKLLIYALAGHDWWDTPLYLDNTIDEMTAWFGKY